MGPKCTQVKARQPSQQAATKNANFPHFKHIESDDWAGSRKSSLVLFWLTSIQEHLPSIPSIVPDVMICNSELISQSSVWWCLHRRNWLHRNYASSSCAPHFLLSLKRGSVTTLVIVLKHLHSIITASPAKPTNTVCRHFFVWAAYNGNEWMVKELLQLPDINPNIKDDLSGGTPLMWAAVAGQEGMVKLLLE